MATDNLANMASRMKELGIEFENAEISVQRFGEELFVLIKKEEEEREKLIIGALTVLSWAIFCGGYILMGWSDLQVADVMRYAEDVINSLTKLPISRR